MKESWRINRIGLVDFWYYDDQEFTFINGRMLLRGSNGSGKSVTMQSVVPLLLDGNMRPERLDPFGSRDRKMSSYLLEEGDGREERIGYLYMEFQKPETGIFHTIGMGMRARRGKSLDSWYFYISDGRRINRDFFLYKEAEGKITLTQKELEHRIGEGGRVLSSQMEYMEYMNKQFFGFESVDEYREMIDLLIQLRTPKLSKDFKPSVINEILSDSLQPLSEEDLRPMSEAIENMDTLSTNLSNKLSSMQAAEKIYRQYDRYNQCILREKTGQYTQALEERRQLQKDIDRREAELVSHAEMAASQQERKAQLEQEQQVLAQERETLNASDAVALKQREADVTARLSESEKNQQEKEQQLNSKQERWVQYEDRCKKAAEQEEQIAEQLGNELDEMREGLETVFIDEHAFFEQEFRESIREDISFDTHLTQLERITAQLESGTQLLQDMEQQKKQKEDLLRRYDEEKKNRSGMERILQEQDTLFQEMISDQKEQIYTWNQDNRELRLSKEQLQTINRFLDSFRAQSDYHDVKKVVSDSYFDSQSILQKKKSQIEARMEAQEDEAASLKEQLQEWQNKEEPEPETSEAVKKNRNNLIQKGIPYHRFYETIDFEAKLEKKAADQLEEALLAMGILDALVIDKSYREQVLRLDPGACDKYIFTDEKYQGENLTDLLTVSEELNDLFGNQQVLSVLGAIGTSDQQNTYIAENGTFGIGVLHGTITGEYQARYIGRGARRRYRQEQIDRLQEQIEAQEAILREMETEILTVDERRKVLEQEYHLLPEGEALHEKSIRIEELRRQLENQAARLQEIEEQLTQMTDVIRLLLEQVQDITEAIYVEGRLDKFEKALKEVRNYYREALELKSNHARYLQTMAGLANAREQMENTDADMEEIRYELSGIRQRIQKEKMELSSILEQLALTNYEEIKEQLNQCLNRLAQIPAEVEHSIRERADHEHEWKNCQSFLETARPRAGMLEDKLLFVRSNLKKELALGYTVYEELKSEQAENWEHRILQMQTALCAGEQKDENKENLVSRLNQTFYENRGYLLDFNLNLENIFEEDYQETYADIFPKRLEIKARYRGEVIGLGKLLEFLHEEIEEIQNLIKSGDKELFEDILANTIGRKIRSKINASMAWVDHMNQLMESMNTSSGLKLSLRWRSKTAELEEQLDTRELVELLKKDARLMTEAEFEKLSVHFRSKVEQARRNSKEGLQAISFFAIMRDTLDYRKWFEFQLYFQKLGEQKKELTNSIFGTFSGGEKAMSMYVPLFSAVVAKYQGGRADAPRIVSLDEAFAGVDNRNIRDMFRLMSEFQFNFIINSQVLWGDCDTLDGLAIYQLHRLNNQKFVTVMSFIWNGNERKSVREIRN